VVEVVAVFGDDDASAAPALEPETFPAAKADAADEDEKDTALLPGSAARRARRAAVLVVDEEDFGTLLGTPLPPFLIVAVDDVANSGDDMVDVVAGLRGDIIDDEAIRRPSVS
jgi:hypothetical protein